MTRAFDVSRRAGYVSFCRNETGRLLAALAATREGTMAEFGTGCGVGTAWLRSGVRGDDTRILTAELDPTLAEAAAEIFRDDAQVEVLAADWSTLLDRDPFSLLFLDSGEPSASRPDKVADLIEPTAGSSSSTTSRPASRGRRSSTAASTPCARSGSATTASPPSR